jgi:hypothetical protein
MGNPRYDIVGVSSLECRGIYRVDDENTRVLLRETPVGVVVHTLRCGVTHVLCPNYTNDVESKCGAPGDIEERAQCPYRVSSPND